MTAKAQWFTTHLAYLRGLKAPTDAQRLLILLADKPDRTPAEEKTFAALVRAEKAAEFAARTRAEANSLIKAKRKARTRQLIRMGEILLEMVDRGQWPRDELLQMMDERLTKPADRALFGLDARGGTARPSQPPPAAINWKDDFVTQAIGACVQTYRSLSSQLKRVVYKSGETL